MNRFAGLIFLWMGIILGACAQDSLKVERLRASFEIAVSDYSRLQSLFGHGFVRMECPEQNVDICYSLETGGLVKPWSIASGRYMARVFAMPTKECMREYEEANRPVDEYELNLTPEEIRTLWKRLDEKANEGDVVYNDFIKQGCSQVMMNIIMECVDGRVRFDEKVMNELGTTPYEVASRALSSTSMMKLFGSLIVSNKGRDTFIKEEERLFVPSALHSVLTTAIIRTRDGGSRPLITNKVTKSEPIHEGKVPLIVWLALALAATVALTVWERLHGHGSMVGRIADAALFVMYMLIALLILGVSSTSNVEYLSGWNASMLSFNLLPLILWLINKVKPINEWIMECLGLAMVSAMVFSVYFLNKIGIEVVVVIMIFATRLYARGAGSKIGQVIYEKRG